MTSRSDANGKEPSSGKGLRHLSLYLLLAPVLILAATAAILHFVFPDLSVQFEPVWLSTGIFLVVFAAGSLLAVLLAARAYRAGGSPLALSIGCGMLTIGLSCVAGSLLVGEWQDPNAGVTTHNIGMLIAAGICLAGAIHRAFVSAGESSESPRRRAIRMSACHALCALAIAVTAISAWAGMWPPFFTDQGTTTLRLFVLWLAVTTFLVTTALLVAIERRQAHRFLWWYALGLALIAVGLVAIAEQPSVGSPIGWTGRVAQALGQVYVVIGLVSLARRRGTTGEDLAAAFDDFQKALRESENRYRLLFETMTEGFALHEMIFDATGVPCDYRFLDINPAFEQLTGLTRKEVVGRTFSQLLPNEDPKWVQIYGEVVQTGRPAHFENYAAVLQRYYDVLAYRPAAGQFAAVFTDVTDRRLAENSLTEQKNILDAVAANTKAHLVYLDRDFNFIWVNEAYAQACGRNRSELLGHNHFEFYPHEENQAIFERVRDTGQPFDVKEKPFEFPDHPEWGVTYWDWTLTPIKDSSGEVQGLVFSLLDVTHDVAARKEIEKLQVETERRAAELESFLTSMSDGVVLHNSEGRAILSNQAAIEILEQDLQASVEERVQQYGISRLDGTPMLPEETASGRALRGETVRHLRYRMTTTDGRHKVIEVSSSPVRGPEGVILGATTVFRDVTDTVEVERQREELYEREHKIADMLQEALIPSRIPTAIGPCRFAARYLPALDEASVGGDFYDVFDLGSGKVGILIGDVAGKGLAAAMSVSAARYAIRSYAYATPDPSEVMTLANNALSLDQLAGDVNLLTAFFGVIDINTGVLTYSNAGHELPSVLRGPGRATVEDLTVGGRALGVIGGHQYEKGATRLEHEDALVLVTDGITEARDKDGHLFGKDLLNARLIHSTHVTPEQLADVVVGAARDHASGKLTDDVAVLIVSIEDRTP